MAEKISAQLSDDMSPEAKINVINQVLYEELNIDSGGPREDISGTNSPTPGEYSIKDVLISKNGSCVPRTLLYVGLAERLGLPIQAQITPHHAYARYIDGENSFNIECTDHGKVMPDEFYLNHFLTTTQAQAYADHTQIMSAFLMNISRTLSQQGRRDDSLEAAYWAKSLFPEDPTPYSHIAQEYSQNNYKLYKVKIFAEKALDRDADNWQALSHLIPALMNTGDFERATITAEKLIQLYQKQAKINLFVYQQKPKNKIIDDTDALLAVLKQKSENLPPVSHAFELMQQCVAIDEWERANMLLNSMSADSNINRFRSLVAYRLGNFEDAHRYEKIEQKKMGEGKDIKDPVTFIFSCGEVYAQYAKCLYRIGEKEKADEALDIAGMLIPDKDIFYSTKGYIALKEKEYSRAIESYQKALELDPTFDFYKKQLEKAKNAMRHETSGT